MYFFLLTCVEGTLSWGVFSPWRLDLRISGSRHHAATEFFLGVLIGQRHFVTNRSQYKHERKRVGLPQVIHSLALRACMPENLALCN